MSEYFGREIRLRIEETKEILAQYKIQIQGTMITIYARYSSVIKEKSPYESLQETIDFLHQTLPQ